MIKINNPADCCGCTACASVCAHDAIIMQPDSLGFLYPKIDESKCVDCGLCEKVCSFNDNYETSNNFEKPLAYAARHKKMSEIETSRSGAAFIAMSDYILEQGGVVYGAGYADHFRVVHKRATTKEERNEFKGSKYVQSDLNTVFRQVKKDLRDGLTVLFSGTPCQTSGLNSYVGKKLRENLFLVDIGKDRTGCHHHGSHCRSNDHRADCKDDTCHDRCVHITDCPCKCCCAVTETVICCARHHTNDCCQDTDRSCKNITDDAACACCLVVFRR